VTMVDMQTARNRAEAVGRLVMRRQDRKVKLTERWTRVMIEDPVDGAWTIYDARREQIVYAEVSGHGGQVLNLPTSASPEVIAALLTALNGLEDWL
jgi:hypothetical protein